MSGVLVGLHAVKNVADEKGFFTCRVTLVNPGHSDSVIKVYPAKHPEEKIWLDIQPGLQRWSAVKRLFNQFVPRGEAVPEPVAYHSGKDLNTIVISEDDIPVVKLDGAVFEPLAEEKRPAETPKLASSLESRMSAMEAAIGSIAVAIQAIAKPQASIQSEAQGQEPPAAVEGALFECKPCSKVFKNSHALKIHHGREHKA